MGEFGKYISEKRKIKGISLRTMAKDLGISISYLSDLENGNKMPPNSSTDKYKDLISRITEYLNMSEDDARECLNYADKDLIKKGHILNDITDYMEKTPLAGVALRRAKDLNFSDSDWEKIISELKK